MCFKVSGRAARIKEMAAATEAAAARADQAKENARRAKADLVSLKLQRDANNETKRTNAAVLDAANKAAAIAALPAPPPPPPAAVLVTGGQASGGESNDDVNIVSRKKGRGALRIDMNAPHGGGKTGLNVAIG